MEHCNFSIENVSSGNDVALLWERVGVKHTVMADGPDLSPHLNVLCVVREHWLLDLQAMFAGFWS